MSELGAMMLHASTAGALPPTLFAAAGWLFGSVYFAALKHSVGSYVVSGAPVPHNGTAHRAAERGAAIPLSSRAAALRGLFWSLARIGLAALFFALSARWGAPAILAAFLGFLAARHLAVRAARRTS